MRVLTLGNMYPPHHLGGYELTWRSSVEHLRGEGHEVRVVTTDYRSDAPDPNIPEDPDARRELRWYWRDHEFPSISLRDRLELERHNGRVLENQVRDFRPDVVAWWAMGGMSLSLIERVRRTGLPSVGVVGDDWMAYGPKVDAWTRLGPLRAPLSALAGVPGRLDFTGVSWLFNSEIMQRRARESGFRLGPCEVAHPGVDTQLFQPAPAHAWEWRLLYVGRIDERKGIGSAVEAMAGLPGEARLSILGSGDARHLELLRTTTTRLGLDGQVEFGFEPRDRLPAAYAAADALLFPVRWEEPWGIVPLEAMAVGTPVVATGAGGSGEYLRDGENALLVGTEAGPEDLAAAVRRLASDDGLRARLREDGLRTAERYPEAAYNEAIEAALERAVGS